MNRTKLPKKKKRLSQCSCLALRAAETLELFPTSLCKRSERAKNKPTLTILVIVISFSYTKEDHLALDPRIVEVYKGYITCYPTDISVGTFLSKYTSGKIPRAFKVIPSLVNWEEILFLTSPDMWSPPATRQATRIFSSNLSSKRAERLFETFRSFQIFQFGFAPQSFGQH